MSTASPFPTLPSLWFICCLDLHMSGFFLFTFSNSELQHDWFVLMVFMYLSPLQTFTMKCITVSKVNLIFLKNPFNHKLCHLLLPKIRHSLFFLKELLHQPPQLIYFWPHLLQLYIPVLSSNSQSSIWSSALFCLWPDRPVTYWSYFPSTIRTEKKVLEVWLLQLRIFQTVPPTKSQKSALFPVTSERLLLSCVYPK